MHNKDVHFALGSPAEKSLQCGGHRDKNVTAQPSAFNFPLVKSSGTAVNSSAIPCIIDFHFSPFLSQCLLFHWLENNSSLNIFGGNYKTFPLSCHSTAELSSNYCLVQCILLGIWMALYIKQARLQPPACSCHLTIHRQYM